MTYSLKNCRAWVYKGGIKGGFIVVAPAWRWVTFLRDGRQEACFAFFAKKNIVAKFTLLLFRASSETTILFVAAKRQLCSVIANMHLANLLKQSLPICSSKALALPLQILVLLLLFHCRPNPATTIKNYFVSFFQRILFIIFRKIFFSKFIYKSVFSI